MDKATELAVVRRTYAKHVLAEARVEDPRIEAAFATVPREDFLGSGPWLIPRWLIGPVHTPTPDPIYLYSDKVVQIIPERHLNNGLPSAHAKWIAAARPAVGEHVVHIGTGTGYYIAILAHLVGPAGSVTGIEIDPLLAARAQANFRSCQMCVSSTHARARAIYGRRRLWQKHSRKVDGKRSRASIEAILCQKSDAGSVLGIGALHINSAQICNCRDRSSLPDPLSLSGVAPASWVEMRLADQC
jgi:protein-L-isoaspartate O-methyltransferase